MVMICVDINIKIQYPVYVFYSQNDIMVTVFAQIYALLDALISNLLALRLDKRMESKLSSFDVLISFCNKYIAIIYLRSVK